SVFLGATIFPAGTSANIDDRSNNATVSVPPGTSLQTRLFTIPSTTTVGVYDVRWSIWNQNPDNNVGLISYGDVRLSNYLTIKANSLDAASFVSETVPDGTTVSPGQSFTKTWTVRNSGTTTWNSNYKLRWISNAGVSLSAHNDVTINGSVLPGAT